MSGNIQISILAWGQNSHSVRSEGRLPSASKMPTSPGTHVWASSLSSLMPSSSNTAGEVIAALFGKRLTPGRALQATGIFGRFSPSAS